MGVFLASVSTVQTEFIAQVEYPNRPGAIHRRRGDEYLRQAYSAEGCQPAPGCTTVSVVPTTLQTLDHRFRRSQIDDALAHELGHA